MMGQPLKSASLLALTVVLLLHGTPAGATLLLGYEFLPASVTVVQGEDYTLTVRITNNSDAGETFGALPGSDFTISAFTVPAFAGQTVSPLFSFGTTILLPGDAFVSDLALFGGDRGVFGPLALGPHVRTSTFGIFQCTGLLCFGSGIAGPTASVTLNVVAPVPAPATISLVALGLCVLGRRRNPALGRRQLPSRCLGRSGAGLSLH